MTKPVIASWKEKHADVYTHSTLIEKLRNATEQNQRPRIAFLDIDNTLTGTPAEQRAVRQHLEEQGYALVFVTSRTSTLCMSRTVGTSESQAGLLDPDVIAGTSGAELLVKQRTGEYRPDTEYLTLLPPNWRVSVEAVLPQPLDTISPWRIQLRFPSAAQRDALTASLAVRPDILVTDDSHTHDFSFYVTPPVVHKRQPLERIMTAVVSLLHIPVSNVEVLIAGDGPPDLDMGLHGAAGARVTFLVPGGARITPSPQADRTIIRGDQAFPGTTAAQTLLAWLKQSTV